MTRRHRARRHAMAVAHSRRLDSRDGLARQRREYARECWRERRRINRALDSILRWAAR